MKIGSLSLDSRVILAPMAGVTDRPFRTLCRWFGAAYGVTCGDVKIDQGAVVARRGRVVRALVNGVKAKMKAAGVRVFMEEAQICGRAGEDFIVASEGRELSLIHI